MKPIRIQLSRKKGWRMPPNTIRVPRPGKWGNPWRVGPDGSAEDCVLFYRTRIETNIWTFPTIKDAQAELRGKNLACWCPLVDKNGKPVPCHADVLLELANK